MFTVNTAFRGASHHQNGDFLGGTEYNCFAPLFFRQNERWANSLKTGRIGYWQRALVLVVDIFGWNAQQCVRVTLLVLVFLRYGRMLKAMVLGLF